MLKIITLAFTLFASTAFAIDHQIPNELKCSSLANIEMALDIRYQEEYLAKSGPNMLFINKSTGTYTIIADMGDSRGCMMAFGTKWKPGDDIPGFGVVM